MITHDLASARFLADRVLVLFRGRVVENGASEALVEQPAHPYTRALLASIAEAGAPSGAPGKARPRREVPSPEGCPFAARCPEVLDVCREIDPAPRAIGDRTVRCHLYPENVPAEEV
jgi:peptide/nickel transport system ATP-binding protein